VPILEHDQLLFGVVVGELDGAPPVGAIQLYGLSDDVV
jgi:hypothetical protein